jgi:thermitase
MKNFGRDFCLGLAILLILSLPSFADFVPGEMIVRFKPDKITAASALDSLSLRYRPLKVEKLHPETSPPKELFKVLSSGERVPVPDLSRDYRFFFEAQADILKIAEEYKKDYHIEFAQPNYIYRALKTPNDTYYSSQWGLNKIDAEPAWDLSTGEAQAVQVAVVDTGVNYNHEDLIGRVVLGYNYINNNNNPMDDNGHGTHIAGIIGAITDNAKGVAGVNWNARILAIKALDYLGRGSSIDVMKGVKFAADDPNTKIINMSFGQYSEDYYVRSGMEYAYAKGCNLVAAAGNEDLEDPIYPAAYTYVIAVAATDQSDKRSIWSSDQASNYGTWVDISAPGTAIYSTWLSGYHNNQGTSMATPFICGVAALLLSKNPTWGQTEVKSRLENTADPIDALNPGFEGKLGKGRLNAAKALGVPTALITNPISSSYQSGTVAVAGTATAVDFNHYRIILIGPATTETLYSSTSSVVGGTLYNFDTTTKIDGIYTLKLEAVSNEPYTTEATVTFVIDNTPPTAEIASPLEGATIEGIASISGKASDANFEYYNLEYSQDGTNYPLILSSSAPQPSGLLGNWNIYNLSGNYVLRLKVKDLAGHFSTSSKNVQILSEISPPPGISTPTKVSPNPFNPTIQSVTNMSYSLTQNYPVTLYLFDLSGNLIWQKFYAAGDMGGKAGDNLVTWDGRTLYGESAQNGVYLYKIVAGGKVIGSGKLVLLRN